MIQQTTINFLKDLRENNNKEWFDANRKTYESARKDIINNVQGLISKISAWDEQVGKLQPKDCIFRINRDIRFSADKSPYKTNMGAWINGKGKNSNGAGYYFHLQPGESFLAGGIYMPMPPQLKAIRQEIDYNLPEFEGLLSAKDFKKYFGSLGGEKLKTTPKEYTKNNKAIEYLRHKSFIMSCKLKDEDLISGDFFETAAKVFKAMAPMNAFLNRSVEVVAD